MNRCSVYGCPTPPTLLDPQRGDWYCTAHATVCAACATLRGTYYVIEVSEGSDHLGDMVCESCAHYCENCGDYWIIDVDECDSCRNAVDYDEDEDGEYGEVSGLRSYGYKPEPIFHGEGPLYLGVEQEMEFSTGSGARAVMNWLGEYDRSSSLFYAKHDGSLSQNGIEIVSHPMSPEWAVNDYPWELQELIGSNGGIPDRHAGMHIHVSRDAFTDYHLWKFVYFHYANPTFVERIAGRDPSQWASLNSKPTRKRMTKPGAVDIAVGDRALHTSIRSKQGGHIRYTAVNLSNRTTAELRYFASTYDPAVMKGYFEYVRALYEFTKIAKVRNRKDPSRDLSGLSFRQWAEASGDYPHFMNLLTLRGIPMESLGKTVNNAGMEWKEQ
jgi:hypothetical protein